METTDHDTARSRGRYLNVGVRVSRSASARSISLPPFDAGDSRSGLATPGFQKKRAAAGFPARGGRGRSGACGAPQRRTAMNVISYRLTPCDDGSAGAQPRPDWKEDGMRPSPQRSRPGDFYLPALPRWSGCGQGGNYCVNLMSNPRNPSRVHLHSGLMLILTLCWVSAHS